MCVVLFTGLYKIQGFILNVRFETEFSENCLISAMNVKNLSEIGGHNELPEVGVSECGPPFYRLSVSFFLWRCDATRVMASASLRFIDHIKRRTTVLRTPLDEWSARHRNLYLTTHNTHNRQTSMPTVGFEPTISAGKRPQNYALDRAATRIDIISLLTDKNL